MDKYLVNPPLPASNAIRAWRLTSNTEIFTGIYGLQTVFSPTLSAVPTRDPTGMAQSSIPDGLAVGYDPRYSSATVKWFWFTTRIQDTNGDTYTSPIGIVPNGSAATAWGTINVDITDEPGETVPVYLVHMAGAFPQ